MSETIKDLEKKMKTHPYGMYGGLPKNIFEKSSLEECLDIDNLDTQVQYYQKRNNIFLKTIEEHIKKWINLEDTHLTIQTLEDVIRLSNRTNINYFQEFFERYNRKAYLNISNVVLFLKKQKIKLLWSKIEKPNFDTKDTHSLYIYKWVDTIVKWNQWSEINRWHYIWTMYQRTISISAFLIWKKAFENHDLRSKYGRDYVPIEPIISFKLRSDNMCTVWSKVLNTTLYDFFYDNSVMVKLHWYELKRRVEKLTRNLELMWIIHNDAFNKNICIQYFYTKSWDIDINRCPRIYLVDWDRAEFM